jgi:spermidine synthase
VESHQFIYDSAYAMLRPHSVLIVGGGTGNEAAAALRHNVERVDVVEIDPVIVEIGRRLHPENPYSDSRVRLINDDARHYMSTTDQKYDLIIFGFLDSTSHLSSMSNIRLDNYVYTVESFQQARRLLKPTGLLQVTYYAVADFVRLRIFLMLQDAFSQAPLMAQVSDPSSRDVLSTKHCGYRFPASFRNDTTATFLPRQQKRSRLQTTGHI